ncbi:SprT-like domain-containing protein Spartan [Tetrabaena socialis]|uniref:SprT-like domain-containing protein Spartan n=1 Tax=Tetrabaena socialis TaxID=47790 RepID=A0A2J7X4E1_9CHLO|nr:SprT-like domain-containing protein Spartan [Tetrabaena socialis]|eukprot:PNG70630.1 SprT-like domain-containing protein Spartan [Tetrabaena socialis]
MDEEEVLEEFPDLHALFLYFNDKYFNGVLSANTTVEWSSKRMTLCGGVCRYHPLMGCQIRLSEPLLKVRRASPRARVRDRGWWKEQ